MIHLKYSITSLLLILFSCDSPEISINPDNTNSFLGEIDFIKTFGGNKNEVANSIVATNDKGYIISGYIDSNDGDITTKSTNDSDYLLLKYNANDQLEWYKTYGGSSDDRGNTVIQTSDNGFAILGFSKSNDGDVTANEGNSDFWLTKLNSTGDLSWQKTFGYSGNDIGFSLIQTSDNGFLLLGELDVTSSGGLGNSKSAKRKHAGGDYWAIKLDVNGEKEWSRFYGGTFTDTPQGIVETADRSFIIAGTSDSNDIDITNPKGEYDFWLIKIDLKGELVWEKNFGGSQTDKVSGITKTNDDNFIIVGNTRSTDKNISINNGGGDLWLVKISPDGNLIWEKTYGGSSFDNGASIFLCKNGDIIIAGNSRSLDNDFTNKGQNDAWFLKITPEGITKWQKFIGGSNIDLLHDVIELDNGNIIAIGESTSNDQDIPENKGFSDVLIIKLK